MAIQPIRIVISGVDKFSAQLAKSMQGIDKMGKKMQSVGRKMTIGLSIPLLAAGVASAKFASDYEQSLSRVQALTGASVAQMEQLRATTQSLGMTTMFSSVQGAQALQLMADSGFKLQDSLTALPDVLNLSTIGMVSLAEAVDIADNLTEGYNRNINEMSQINDILAVTARKGGVGVSQITRALTDLSPVAGQLGLSLEETSATIGVMGTMGINMKRGVMSMRTALTSLIDPSTEAVKTFNKLGVRKSDLFDSAGKLRSLADTMDVLRTKGASSADVMNIFGKQAGPIMARMMEQGGAGIRDFQKSLTGATGAAEELRKAQENTFGGQLKKLQASLVTFGASMGEALLPVLRPLVVLLQKATQWFMTMPGWAKTTIVVLAGIVAVIGPLILALGAIASAISGISVAIGVVAPVLTAVGAAIGGLLLPIALIIAAVAIWAYNLYKIIKYWDDIVLGAKYMASEAGSAIAKWAQDVVNWLQPVLSFFTRIWDAIKGVGQGMAALAGAVLPDWLKEKIGLVPGGTGAGTGAGMPATAAALREGAVGANVNVNETKIVIDNKAGAKVRTETTKGNVDLQSYSGQLMPAVGG